MTEPTKNPDAPAATLCLYGNNEIGWGWLASLEGCPGRFSRHHLGDGTPNIEEYYCATNAIKVGLHEMFKAGFEGPVWIYDAGGERMAPTTTSTHDRVGILYGQLEWRHAPGFEIPVVDLLAAAVGPEDRKVGKAVWKKAAGGDETGWNWSVYTIMPSHGGFSLYRHVAEGLLDITSGGDFGAVARLCARLVRAFGPRSEAGDKIHSAGNALLAITMDQAHRQHLELNDPKLLAQIKKAIKTLLADDGDAS